MKNPVKFLQEVKQYFSYLPTGKETSQGTLMVAAMAIIASFSFTLGSTFSNLFWD